MGYDQWPQPKIAASTEATYHVPKRFGMSGMLAITTLMAVIFGVLRNFPGGLNFSFDANAQTHPVVYIFLGLLVLATCVAQMLYGDVPRAASCIAGAILFPVCILVVFVWNGMLLEAVCLLPFLGIAGAGFGYLAGGCTAGCFLLMDKFDKWYLERVLKQSPAASSPSAEEPVWAEVVEQTYVDKRDRP